MAKLEKEALSIIASFYERSKSRADASYRRHVKLVEWKQEDLRELIPSMSDEELEQIAGGMPCGWICSYTVDCAASSTFVCGC